MKNKLTAHHVCPTATTKESLDGGKVSLEYHDEIGSTIHANHSKRWSISHPFIPSYRSRPTPERRRFPRYARILPREGFWWEPDLSMD